jgi:hypothetical protein
MAATERFFITAGPVRQEDHYHIDPLSRVDYPQIQSLIKQKKYFVLHAPRQTGKTTALFALRDRLNTEGAYRAIYVNVEPAQAFREDIPRAMEAILDQFRFQGEIADDPLLLDLVNAISPGTTGSPLNALLRTLSVRSPQPVVLMLDEIDSLVGDTLISVLRQIRAGYPHRPESFPASVILCGVRDVRDYRLHSGSTNEVISGGSAFNIKAESITVGNFSPAEIRTLYRQHTDESGQPFADDVFLLVWDLTAGQPWLVNALAYETCWKIPAGRNRKTTITASMMAEAAERLIRRRETHLDQLADKLQEERVRRVVAPLLEGNADPQSIPEDDLQYVMDLGLVSRWDNETIGIANQMYREVIPRQLTWSSQMMLPQQTPWYTRPDGSLDMTKLLAAFQDFFREHSESWIERFAYKEAGPQLLLQAFLQRIVNGGGVINREYGLGRMRTDLFIQWPLPEPGQVASPAESYGDEEQKSRPGSWRPIPVFHASRVQRIVIECKVLHKSRPLTEEQGLAQTEEYLRRVGAGEGHLIIFDRRSDVPWEEKISHHTTTAPGGTVITVWGM